MAPYHSTHSPRGKLECAVEQWLVTPHYSVWHCSLVVISGKRMAEKGACCGRIESYRKCWCVLNSLPQQPCLITPHYWITSSHPDGSISYISPLAVAWQENRRVLRSAVRLWCAFTVIGISLKDLIFLCDPVYIHTVRNSRLNSTSHTSSWEFVCCCAAEHLAGASVWLL
jgi:hypothetical protein